MKRAKTKNLGPCCVEGCERPSKTREMCAKHYLYFSRHGQPISTKTAKLESRKWLEDHVGWSERKECLIFPYGKISSGYAMVNDGPYKNIYAHRYMCTQTHGSPPTKDHEVAHNCGNPECVNPHHLRWDTRVGNMSDKVKHGTLLYGENHPARKLTLVQAREVFTRAWAGESTINLAAEFGICPSNVSVIKHGGSWNIDLDEEQDTVVKSEKAYFNNVGIQPLTDDQVRRIRDLIAGGISMREVASMMGISYGRVRSINAGDSYARVA